MSNPRRVQCGATDCKRAAKRDYMRQYQRDVAAKTGTWANAKYRSRKSNSHCVDCGTPVGHGSTQETRCRKCCGRRLAEQAKIDARRRAYRRRAERKLAKAAEGVTRGWVFSSGPCHSCGEVFTCFVTGEPAKYCSITCSRRESRAVRRARQKVAHVTQGQRWRTFERDGWVCRICGDSVNREAKVPALDAPVLDHRIPLAAGGDHAPENWQTAHFYCNSVKRDQVDFDFAEVAA